MYILASDYDGTLKTRIHDLKTNILLIKKFMNMGNVFILATGRNFESIKEEINLFGIKFNYLICNDGAAIFDNNCNLISSKEMKAMEVEQVINIAKQNININSINIYSPKTKNGKVENIIEIELFVQPFKNLNVIIDDLMEKLPNLSYSKYLNRIFIKYETNKSLAIQEILKNYKDIKKNKVYTIGDGANDIEMLKDFNGFRLLESYPILWNKVFKIVPETHHLVRYLNKKSK